MNDVDPAVRFTGVGMRYGDGDEVLRDISFALGAGTFTYLTGPSGAGKSSLLKLLYLAHRPARGDIALLGRSVGLLDRRERAATRREIGVVFQDFRLIEHLSAAENVALPLRISGQPREEARANVEELLAWVGLADRMDAPAETLSGGEKQRVAIARAIVSRPRLLVADEPTGSVDPDIGHRLMRLFQEMNRLGTTTLVATHDAHLIDRYPAPVLRLDGGRLVEEHP